MRVSEVLRFLSSIGQFARFRPKSGAGRPLAVSGGPASASPCTERGHPTGLVMLDPAGRVRRKVRLDLGGVFELAEGQPMLHRIHVADRVGFMRAVSSARTPGAGPVAIDVRVNRAPPSSEQDFVDVNMILMPSANAGDVALAVALDNGGETTAVPDPVPDGDSDRLAIVSHELRTPLNAIIGFAELLRGDAAVTLPPQRQRDYVGLIHGAATHLLSVVNTMLDVSKIGAGHYAISREPFDLGETISEAVSMLAPRARTKSIHVNLHLERVGDRAFADRRAVRQIALNLLSNAIKFTPENGCVTIEAETGAAGLVLTVADTGIGIDAGDIERLGQPFQQVDNSYTRTCEGTGLGLSLIKGLAGLHGGDMQIESTPAIGTRVTVRLPVAGPEMDGKEQLADRVTYLRPAGTELPDSDEENDHAPLRFG